MNSLTSLCLLFLFHVLYGYIAVILQLATMEYCIVITVDWYRPLFIFVVVFFFTCYIKKKRSLKQFFTVFSCRPSRFPGRIGEMGGMSGHVFNSVQMYEQAENSQHLNIPVVDVSVA